MGILHQSVQDFSMKKHKNNYTITIKIHYKINIKNNIRKDVIQILSPEVFNLYSICLSSGLLIKHSNMSSFKKSWNVFYIHIFRHIYIAYLNSTNQFSKDTNCHHRIFLHELQMR